MDEKLQSFGFVYMWCDTKRDKYYIGSHKGRSVTTRYKCGNKRMLNVIAKRPETCKRVIIEYCYIDDRNELYKLEEKWLKFHNVAKNNNFYNRIDVAKGPVIPVSINSPKKRRTMKEMNPNWINPRKGVRVLSKKSPIPARPFILIFHFPNGEIREKKFNSIKDCNLSSNISVSTLLKLSIDKTFTIKRIFKNSKHFFPGGTLIKLQYVDDNGKEVEYFNDEEQEFRRQLLKNKQHRSSERAKTKRTRIIGKRPKSYIIRIYEPDKPKYDVSIRTDAAFISEYGVNSVWISQLKARKIKSITARTERTLHPFPVGTVIELLNFDGVVKDTRSPKDIYLPFLIEVFYPNNLTDKIICYTLSDFEKKFNMSRTIANMIKKNGYYEVKPYSWSNCTLTEGTILKYYPLTERKIISLHCEKFYN